MANKRPLQKSIQKAKAIQNLPEVPVTSIFPFSFHVKLIVLAILTFILYANTLGNSYCLDDGIVIEKNQYVQQGFGGIGKIMTTDAYDSYHKYMNVGQQLSGGRYRPLSEVVFAIEHSLFSESPNNSIAFQRHLFNVLCYILCVLVILYFLSRYLLEKLMYGADIAFFAAILFSIHPIHTEVVANIKSLDEILSMLFICLTFIFSLRYIDYQKRRDFVIALVLFFFSLLAKEYAVVLLVLIPMLFYLLRNKNLAQILASSWGYFLVFVVYMVLRRSAVGFNRHMEVKEILNNPYLLATHTQKIATELFVLGKYLWMLIVPYPLICDYSYAQIPYQSFTNPAVLFTVFLYVVLIIWGIRLLMKRNVLAFAVFFYLLCLLLVSNFMVDIGATMGERLIFHSSLGFVILVSYGGITLIKEWTLEHKRLFIFNVSSLFIVVFGYETRTRNLNWKNDIVLYTHDVKIGTNSIMLNGNAGARYLYMAEQTNDSIGKTNKLDTALIYLRKSIVLHKGSPYYTSYINMGHSFIQLGMFDSANAYWSIVKSTYPTYPNLQKYFSILARLYLAQGTAYAGQHNYGAAMQEIYKGIRVDSTSAELWYNLGSTYFTWGKYDSAYYAWNRTLQIDPDNAEAKNSLSQLTRAKKGIRFLTASKIGKVL